MYGAPGMIKSMTGFKIKPEEEQIPPSFADFVVHGEKFLFEFLAELRLRDYGLWDAPMGVRVNGKEINELFAKVQHGDKVELFMKPANR